MTQLFDVPRAEVLDYFQLVEAREELRGKCEVYFETCQQAANPYAKAKPFLSKLPGAENNTGPTQ